MDADNLIITCSVCQETLADVENTRVVVASPVCGHCYHSDCIGAWFRKSTRTIRQGGMDLAEVDVNDLDGKCPVCSSNFRLNFGIQLYLNTEENLEVAAQKKKLEADLELKNGQTVSLQSENASLKSQNISLKDENESLKLKCTSLGKALANATIISRKLISQPTVNRTPSTSIARSNSLRSASGNQSQSPSSASGPVGRKRNFTHTATLPSPTSRKPSTRVGASISTTTVSFLTSDSGKKAKKTPVMSTVRARDSLHRAASFKTPVARPDLRGILKNGSAYSQETPTAGASTYSGPVTRSRDPSPQATLAPTSRLEAAAQANRNWMINRRQ